MLYYAKLDYEKLRYAELDYGRLCEIALGSKTRRRDPDLRTGKTLAQAMLAAKRPENPNLQGSGLGVPCTNRLDGWLKVGV